MEVDYCVCFQLGKAIRQGDAESFFEVYDRLPIPVKEEGRSGDHISPVEVIKEFARQISGLSANDYELVERASLEKKLPPSQTFDSELLRNSYTYTCTKLVGSLLKKLQQEANSGASDSGVYSDDGYFVQNKGPNAQPKSQLLLSQARPTPEDSSREPLACPTNGCARKPLHLLSGGDPKRDVNTAKRASSCHHLYPPAATRRQQLSPQFKDSGAVWHLKSRTKKAALSQITVEPQRIISNKLYAPTKQVPRYKGHAQTKQTSAVPHYKVPPLPAVGGSKTTGWHSTRQRTRSPKWFPEEFHNKSLCRTSLAVNGHLQDNQPERPNPKQGCHDSTSFNQAQCQSTSDQVTDVYHQQESALFNHKEAAEFLQQTWHKFQATDPVIL